MRRIIVLTALLCCLGTVSIANVSHAQAPPPVQGQREKGGGELKKLAAALDLTPSQIAQIKPILKSAREQIEQIRNDSNSTPAQKQTQIEQLRKSLREQIKPILTSDQIAKWKSLMESRRKPAPTS